MERGLLGSTFVLCGLRYSPAQIDALYRNLSMTLEDSTTYQLIFGKGEARGRTLEAQGLLIALGVQRFGQPDAATEAAVRAVNDRERLERMALRVASAAGWKDLLATP